jgi:hypothetical protein
MIEVDFIKLNEVGGADMECGFALTGGRIPNPDGIIIGR